MSAIADYPLPQQRSGRVHGPLNSSKTHSSAVSSSLLAALAFVYNWPFDCGNL